MTILINNHSRCQFECPAWRCMNWTLWNMQPVSRTGKYYRVERSRFKLREQHPCQFECFASAAYVVVSNGQCKMYRERGSNIECWIFNVQCIMIGKPSSLSVRVRCLEKDQIIPADGVACIENGEVLLQWQSHIQARIPHGRSRYILHRHCRKFGIWAKQNTRTDTSKPPTYFCFFPSFIAASLK